MIALLLYLCQDALEVLYSTLYKFLRYRAVIVHIKPPVCILIDSKTLIEKQP